MWHCRNWMGNEGMLKSQKVTLSELHMHNIANKLIATMLLLW